MSAGRIAIAAIALGLALLSRRAQADEREQFFESRVRPLLVQRCGSCHGPEKQQGGVRVDLRSAVFGGESGPLVAPGKPDDSRLIQVIRYSGDDVQMPPKGKLPDAEIQVLTQWVQQGAYWPEAQDAPETRQGLPKLADGGLDFKAAAEQHWSFRPLAGPRTLPTVPTTKSDNPVDQFLEQSRQAKGLTASSLADRHTLIRRVTLDLWGIPPTWDEVEAFVHDDQPDAWGRLIDRLLASPLYGQRWGRHWLDIARYADTKGYVFTENHKYPFSYTYRDYVIDAFNADKPFDRFIVEQLAADRLGLPEGDPALAALGFITAGPRYLNREPDIIDDRIDLVTRGLMGLTVACARCHDHKYDPIPTADYYSLYGVFASSTEPDALPCVGHVDESTAGYQAYTAELTKRQQAVDEYVAKVKSELLNRLRDEAGDYLLAAIKKANAPGAAEAGYAHGEPRERLIGVWQAWLSKQGRQQGPVFGLAFDVAQAPAPEFSAKLTALLAEPGEGSTAFKDLNPRLREFLQKDPPQNLTELMRRYEQLFQQVDAEWQTALSAGGTDVPRALPDPASEQLRQVIQGDNAVTKLDEATRLFDRDHRDEIKKLERKVEEWQVESPDAPPRAMVLNDKERPEEPVIFIRGDVGRRGDKVPRQPPRILTDGESRKFTDGSGRLELAHAIVSPQNPLTARVLVNRVWAWHFGRGLVTTQSDFGLRGDPPTHPELLDWLAGTFMHQDGWSLKALHRRILTSEAYQQSSAPNDHAAAVDPENLLYWRFPRQRLEFEPMRDSLLAVAGRLDTSLGGRPVEIEQPPFSNRRSVYGLIDRNNFSSLLRTFDYPSPDATSPARPVTTVPQQSLYALNSPFVRAMAEDVAREVSMVATSSADDRGPQVTTLYRRVLSRDPTEAEAKLAGDFLRHRPDDLVLLAQSLLLTNEFVFVD
jgi:mono/diheme cytochrome c family protein